MYNIIKNVVQAGNFELSDILKKIDVVWLKGDISDEQRSELIALAQEKATPQNSLNFIKKIEEMDKRIVALEAKLAEGDSSDTESGDVDEGETPSAETYPEFEVGKWYYTGDKITFNGKNYECAAPQGTPCVWNPVDYPPYWKEI